MGLVPAATVTVRQTESNVALERDPRGERGLLVPPRTRGRQSCCSWRKARPFRASRPFCSVAMARASRESNCTAPCAAKLTTADSIAPDAGGRDTCIRQSLINTRVYSIIAAMCRRIGRRRPVCAAHAATTNVS